MNEKTASPDEKTSADPDTPLGFLQLRPVVRPKPSLQGSLADRPPEPAPVTRSQVVDAQRDAQAFVRSRAQVLDDFEQLRRRR